MKEQIETFVKKWLSLKVNAENIKVIGKKLSLL